MSRVALIVAGIYFTIAKGIAVWEAMSPPSGGWISLRHIGTFLATFPVAALLAASAALIYRVVDLIVWFFTLKYFCGELAKKFDGGFGGFEFGLFEGSSTKNLTASSLRHALVIGKHFVKGIIPLVRKKKPETSGSGFFVIGDVALNASANESGGG